MENFKVKVLLKVLDKHNLIFQVLYMDERFQGHCYEGNANVTIASSFTPSLTMYNRCLNKIYLWGRGEENDRADVVYVDDAEKVKKRIITALKDWADNWEGFKTNSMSCANNDIYFI